MESARMRGPWRTSEPEAPVHDSLLVSHTTILANQRQRDILTLYGPISQGEPLPDFPAPTHSHYIYYDELGLQRWNTFQGTIDGLERVFLPITCFVVDRRLPGPSGQCDVTIYR